MVYRVLIFAGVREAGPGPPAPSILDSVSGSLLTQAYTPCATYVPSGLKADIRVTHRLLWAITGLMHCSEESLFDQLVSPP